MRRAAKLATVGNPGWGRYWSGPPNKRYKASDPGVRRLMQYVIHLRDVKHMPWRAIGEVVEAYIASLDGLPMPKLMQRMFDCRLTLRRMYEAEKAIQWGERNGCAEGDVLREYKAWKKAQKA